MSAADGGSSRAILFAGYGGDKLSRIAQASGTVDITVAGNRFSECFIDDYHDYINISSCSDWKAMRVLRRSRALKQFRHPRRQDKPQWRVFYNEPDDYVAPLAHSPFQYSGVTR